MSNNKGSIYTLPFVLLCLSSMLFSTSFNMLIPELPDYLSSSGGAEYKGLIIALFTLTAGIARPFSGKLTDTVGRVPVMAIGSLVCVICGILYPILSSVSGFLLLRLIHGFSTGFKPTATAAYIADIIPQERWGEALGMHGLAFSLGMAIGPAIGSSITRFTSINGLFYTSSAIALISVVILLNMRETLTTVRPWSGSLLRISRHDIIDLRVFPAALVTVLYYLTYGVILTLIPDWTGHMGSCQQGAFLCGLHPFLTGGAFSGRPGFGYAWTTAGGENRSDPAAHSHDGTRIWKESGLVAFGGCPVWSGYRDHLPGAECLDH